MCPALSTINRETTVELNSQKKYSFSGHETFPFRYTWLPKGVQGIQRYPDLFIRDDAMVILGVGRNMVKSIRHWCETLRLIEFTERGRSARPTLLGSALFAENGWDPYLEDPGTLWLLHWLLVSRQDRASTWHLAFTQFNKADLFSRDDLMNWILRLLTQVPHIRVTPASLRRDVEVFIRTYAPSHASRDLPLEDTFDCPLVELGLLREVDHGLFQFVRGSKPSLPNEIFIYALMDFWQRIAPHTQTLSFEAVLHGPGSPGAAFKLSESALALRLEQLPIWTGLIFDETAGMRVILRSSSLGEVNLFAILARYYKRVSQGASA
jgi:hypothetical protein